MGTTNFNTGTIKKALNLLCRASITASFTLFTLAAIFALLLGNHEVTLRFNMLGEGWLEYSLMIILFVPSIRILIKDVINEVRSCQS